MNRYDALSILESRIALLPYPVQWENTKEEHKTSPWLLVRHFPLETVRQRSVIFELRGRCEIMIHCTLGRGRKELNIVQEAVCSHLGRVVIGPAGRVKIRALDLIEGKTGDAWYYGGVSILWEAEQSL